MAKDREDGEDAAFPVFCRLLTAYGATAPSLAQGLLETLDGEARSSGAMTAPLLRRLAKAVAALATGSHSAPQILPTLLKGSKKWSTSSKCDIPAEAYSRLAVAELGAVGVIPVEQQGTVIGAIFQADDAPTMGTLAVGLSDARSRLLGELQGFASDSSAAGSGAERLALLLVSVQTMTSYLLESDVSIQVFDVLLGLCARVVTLASSQPGPLATLSESIAALSRRYPCCLDRLVAQVRGTPTETLAPLVCAIRCLSVASSSHESDHDTKVEDPAGDGMDIDVEGFTKESTESIGGSSVEFSALPALLDALVPRLKESAISSNPLLQRHCLATLQALAHLHAALLSPTNFPTILSFLSQATAPDPAKLRTVQMGPCRHVIDEGAEARRTALETVLLLLDAIFAYPLAKSFDKYCACCKFYSVSTAEVRLNTNTQLI